MVNEQQVLEALEQVLDPELRRSVVELGMIHDITIDENAVSLTLALTTMACPLRGSIMADVEQALFGLDGVDDVQVTLREMTAEEKRRSLGARPQQAESGAAAQLNRIGQVIAVMSGKGGVGKSSVAALLAVALQQRSMRVGVLDADITGPSIPKMFGLSGTPPAGPVGILPAETRSGIRVMSINLLLPSEDDAVIWRGPLIAGAIQQFWGDVLWGDLDVLVVDLPPGTSDASLTVMQSIPLNGIVLITSPQGLAGMVVRKAGQMARQMQVPLLGIVENMSYTICPRCGEQIEVFGQSKATDTARALGVPLLGRLPLDPELARRCDAGEIESYIPEHFGAIVEAILERIPAKATVPLFGR
jgi:Mrp family chromosome partitioning ATPase